MFGKTYFKHLQLIKFVGYNEKSDIYSVGMVICELANGSEPFAGMSSTLMLTEKVRGCTPQLLDCSTVPRDVNGDCSGGKLFLYHIGNFLNYIVFLGDCDISPKIVNRRFSEDLHEVAGLCLNREPYDRPTAEQLLSHPIFKTIRKSLPLTDLLKPAMPLSDKVAFNRGKALKYHIFLTYLAPFQMTLKIWTS